MTRANDSRSTPEARAVGALVDEMRAVPPRHASGGVEWDRVDDALFARIERESSVVRAMASHRGRPQAWLLLGGVAAAAAATAMFLGSADHAKVPLSFASSNLPAGSAGDLTAQGGAGDVRVAGTKAGAGARAIRGAVVETGDVKAVFDAPGRVLWMLEGQSRVEVERAGGPGAPVVLALGRGAVEAQVAPVASGEAFAVDVDGVRVAVHGTHLRVAREGGHVVVDLSEGVVSIGAPPKSGSTYGTLVTAPAHVEFESSALGSSLTIDHLANAVRAAADLRASQSEEATSASPPPRVIATREGHAPPAAPRAVLAPATAHPASTGRSATAEEEISAAVRACASAQPRSGDVQVTVSSTIAIQLHEDGSVKLAHFDPPLAPEIQACATRAIFATRFVDSADHKIPVTF